MQKLEQNSPFFPLSTQQSKNLRSLWQVDQIVLSWTCYRMYYKILLLETLKWCNSIIMDQLRDFQWLAIWIVHVKIRDTYFLFSLCASSFRRYSFLKSTISNKPIREIGKCCGYTMCTEYLMKGHYQELDTLMTSQINACFYWHFLITRIKGFYHW